MRREIGLLMIGVAGLWLGWALPAGATHTAKHGCPTDSVRSGTVCIDKYEASMWRTANTSVIKKIRKGTVALADLTAAGATQLGLTAGDLAAAGCLDTGNGCVDVYAVSIPGVTPSQFATWFQAAAAARNSYKRLPDNAEWQAAALGTPDGAPCIVSAGGPGPTGTGGCVSNVGTFDMVGNIAEWVADWVPRSTTCVSSLLGSFDSNCLAGASTTSGPGALVRGGRWDDLSDAGVFSIFGDLTPAVAPLGVGFRCAR